MEDYSLPNNTRETLTIHGISESDSYVIVSYLVLIALIGIPGNMIIIAVIAKLRKKSTTDYYVLSIAAFDLFSSVVNTTCFILRTVPSLWTLIASIHICRFHFVSLYATNIASAFLFAATAIDRYRRTQTSLPTDSPSAPRKAKSICVIISISSIIYGTFILVPVSLDPATLVCRMSDSNVLKMILRGILACTFPFLLIVVVVCYTRISLILYQNRRKVHAMQRTGTSTTRSEAEVHNMSAVHVISIDNDIPNTLTNKSADVQSSICKHNRELCKPDTSNATMQRDSTMKLTTTSANYQLCVKDENLRSSGRGYRQTRNISRRKNVESQTTLMLFLITMVFVITWMCNWAVYIYKATFNVIVLDLGLDLVNKMFMLNAITNPVFYMVMSSKFRERAKHLLSRIFS